MKKILAALTLIALIFTACTEETKDSPVTISLSKTTATELGLASNHSHMMFTVSNTTTNEATIQWEHEETASVTGWTYSTNGSSAVSGELTIPANGSVDVTFMVMPNGNAGVGTGTLKFYDAADQSLTEQAFNYSLTTVTQYFEVIAVDPTSQTARASSNDDKDFKMKLYNPNTSDITVQWASSMNTNNPSSWAVNVCDPFSCFLPNVVDGAFPVPAGDSVDFKFTFDHNNTLGSGGATATFYATTDSANSITNQTVNYDVQ